jgi:hypothetical protein
MSQPIKLYTISGFAEEMQRSHQAVRCSVLAYIRNKNVGGYKPDSFRNQYPSYQILIAAAGKGKKPTIVIVSNDLFDSFK